jgi:glucose/arabinose dehydrogenase
MGKKAALIIGLILLLLAAYWAADYFAWFKNSAPIEQTKLPISDELKTNEPITSDYALEEFASGFFVPWSLVFTSPDRLLVAERSGAIRVIENKSLLKEPLASFKVSTQSEEGLMGLAIAPNYGQTKDVYACLAYENPRGEMKDKVIVFDGESGKEKSIVIDNLPAAQYHAGCRLLIVENYLFITVGDATDRNIAQDKNSLGGKILRLNLDGSIPSDNLFPDSAVWTLGHRNPQGLAWDSERKILWSSEHGPSIFDGPAGGDEINLIEKGKNYGWPIVSHDKSKAGLENPIIQFTPAVAPGSLMYYSGDALPFFRGNLFFGGLKGEGLYRLILQENIRQKPRLEKIPKVNFGRIRDVIQGPDGFIYFTTSNRDGRGTVRANDDKIYRLVPKY